MPKLPPRQVCPLCVLDGDITVFPIGDGREWTYTCSGVEGGHEPWSWTGQVEKELEGREGIASEFGIYDDLLQCVHADEPWVEHGVVEHRYKALRPEIYFGVLLDRWGHVAQGSRRYSVTSFLARTLGQLSRDGSLAWQYTAATGFFSYNGKISYWAGHPAPPAEQRLSWADYAIGQRLDPMAWDLTRMP